MSKSINKVFKITGYLLAVLIGLLMIFLLAVQFSWIQTKLGNAVASLLIDDPNMDISIGSIAFKPVKSLIIDDVLVLDHHKDTLIYLKKLELDISEYDLSKRILDFNSLYLNKGLVNMTTYQDEEMSNIQVFIDQFISENTEPEDTTNAFWSISLNDLKLSDLNVNIENRNMAIQEVGMDFNHLFFQDVEFEGESIYIVGDSVNAQINKFITRERSGLDLNKFHSKLVVSNELLALEDFSMDWNSSGLTGDVYLGFENYADLGNFEEKVFMNVHLQHGRFNLSDVGFFAHDFTKAKDNVEISGQVKGKLSQLNLNDFHMKYSDATNIDVSGSLTGLPNIYNTFLNVKIERLHTNYLALKAIHLPPFNDQSYLYVPDQTAPLGEISFNGMFKGLITDFLSEGNLKTQCGDMDFNLAVVMDTTMKNASYKGNVSTQLLSLGRIISTPDIGNIGFNFQIEGSGLTLKTLDVVLDGDLPLLELKGYAYQNTKLKGELRNRFFNGQLNIDDPNILMNFNGGVDLASDIPSLEFDMRLDSVNLFALNLSNRDSVMKLKLKLNAGFEGKNFESFKGELSVKDMLYTEGTQNFKLNRFHVVADEKIDSVSSIDLLSDIVEGQFRGKIKSAELIPTLDYMIASVIPAYYDSVPPKPEINQDFSYKIVVRNPDSLLSIFYPDLKLVGDVVINGDMQTENDEVHSNIIINGGSYKGNEFKEIGINAEMGHGIVISQVNINRIMTVDSTHLDDVSFTTNTASDNLRYQLTWDNIDSVECKGKIHGLITLLNKQSLNVELYDSEIILVDTVWHVHSRGPIEVDTSGILVTGIDVFRKNEKVTLEGKINSNQNDFLKLEINDFNLGHLGLIPQEPIDISGKLNCKTSVFAVTGKAVAEATLDFKNFSMDKQDVGNGNVKVDWKGEDNSMKIHGEISQKGKEIHAVYFDGHYLPEQPVNQLNMNLTLNEFDFGFLQPVLSDYLSELKGNINGNLLLTGSPTNPGLNGEIRLDSTFLNVIMLNSRYAINNQSLVIKSNSISCKKVKITDERGKEAKLTADLTHTLFSDIKLNVVLDANDFQFMNTTLKDNESYYGSAFLSGITTISGTPKDIRMDISVKTEKNTRFFIPLSGSENVTESDFIVFIKKSEGITNVSSNKYKADLSGLTMILNLEVTPDAEVQIIFDETVGDIMKARGKGDLKMEITSHGDFNMFGEFEVFSGDYLFTMMNIINKKFEVEPGGKITWQGSPYEATISLNAVYKIKATLQELMASTGDSSAIYKKRIPVDCKLQISENIMKPGIRFGLDFPSLDDNTKAKVLSQINSEEEMNKQMFSLLLIKQFISPSGGISAGSAGSSNSSELLSNQLSNWLSQISSDFDIGFKWVPGDEVNEEQMELALSTQLFNDRVTFEGNVGTGGDSYGNQSNQSGIVGDFTLEYKIREDGKLRAKVFTETNEFDPAQSSMGKYTQGVGLFYRKDFNSMKDFKFIKFKKKTREFNSESLNDDND